jgi:hypothetical protein
MSANFVFGCTPTFARPTPSVIRKQATVMPAYPQPGWRLEIFERFTFSSDPPPRTNAMAAITLKELLTSSPQSWIMGTK